MGEKILVPVDGSPTMEKTVRFACDLAELLEGTLSLINVVVMPFPSEEAISFNLEPLEQMGREILEDAQKLVAACGCKADTILDTGLGNASHTIVTAAREKGFTLIVMHARGHSKAESLLIGSVCHGVAHRSPCPVLIVRP